MSRPKIVATNSPDDLATRVKSPRVGPLLSPLPAPGARQRVEPPQIDIGWSAAATRGLNAHISQSTGEELPSVNADVRAAILTKRAFNLVVRQSIRRALSAAKPLYPALQTQLESIEAPRYQLDVAFTDDAAMQDLNSEYRGKNKPTDVLSFPVWEGEMSFPNPPGESGVMLGDMVISIETATRQAAELGHDLRVELAFLAAHGTLHLLGYDHDTDGRRRVMFALQDEIVAQLREDGKF